MVYVLAFQQNIYSYDMVQDLISAKVTIEEQEYTMNVNFSKVIKKDDPELFSFYAIFFKSMMRMMSFE